MVHLIKIISKNESVIFLPSSYDNTLRTFGKVLLKLLLLLLV